MNDFILLSIDNPYPLEHAKIAVTVFGLGGGSPIVLGDNYRTLDEERLKMVKLCLPRTGLSAKPVDLFERTGSGEYSRVMKLAINKSWDSWLLVGAYNLDEKPYHIRLDFESLGLEKNEKYVIWDFWNNEYCGIFRGSFPFDIPSSSTRLLRVMKYKSHPWLLSTDMHIQQGAAEVAEMSWDEDKMQLKAKFIRPKGEKGNAFILMPRNFRLLEECTRGLNIIKELLDFNVIIRVPLDFKTDSFDLELCFGYWKLGKALAPRSLMPYTNEDEWKTYMKTHYTKEDTRVFE
jgi:hypothetical protein